MLDDEKKIIGRSHNKFYQIAKDFIAECPKCSSIKISIRKRKTPKYKCNNCGTEFDDPNAKIVQRTQKQKDDFGRQYSNPDQ